MSQLRTAKHAVLRSAALVVVVALMAAGAARSGQAALGEQAPAGPAEAVSW